MGQYLSSNSNTEDSEQNPKDNAPPLSPSPQKTFKKKNSFKIGGNSPKLEQSIESAFSQGEISSLSLIYSLITKLDDKKTGVIDLQTFKEYLGLSIDNDLVCLEWFTSTLFYSFWCLKEYYCGSEIGKAHNIFDGVDIEDINDFNQLVYLTKNDILTVLPVFLFDRILPQNYIDLHTSKTLGASSGKETWKLRVQLIWCSFIEVQNFFLPQFFKNEDDLKNDKMDELHKTNTDFGNIEETDIVKVRSSMDDFLEMMENSQEDYDDLGFVFDLHNIGIHHLKYLMQSLYIIFNYEDAKKSIERKNLSQDLENNSIVTEDPDTLDDSLKYIENWCMTSAKECFRKNYKSFSEDHVMLGLEDTIEWMEYCGEGIMVHLMNFLSSRFLQAPLQMIMEESFSSRNSFQAPEIESKINQLLSKPHSGIIDPVSLFLLSIKVTSLGKTWGDVIQSGIFVKKNPNISTSFSQGSFDFSQSMGTPTFSQSTITRSSTDLFMANHNISPNMDRHEIGLSAWDLLFSTEANGLAMRSFLGSALYYNAPTVLLISGTVSDSDSSRSSSNLPFNNVGPLFSVPPVYRSKVSKNVMPLKLGSEIKLGVYVSTAWKESQKHSFGDSNCFVFMLEPYFLILPSRSSIKPRKQSISGSFISSKNNNESHNLCFAACSDFLGLRFGGTLDYSKTSAKFSSSLINDSSYLKANPALVVDMSAERALFINDPFAPSPNPTYALISSLEPFKIDISISTMELYGLGGQKALIDQEKMQKFDKNDSLKRRNINIGGFNTQRDDNSVDQQNAKWLLETAGILPNNNPQK
ncbi:hypothetical protein BB558_002635 [Smittium angustum]|uniref:TLDc domain-containing protein n=1 Tax=Smittium angustum TaxID=133377 RepID=A0A2U1J8H2_SMIAN|nr:hypothetical protein BB558_002635 [Smittium angustum]